MSELLNAPKTTDYILVVVAIIGLVISVVLSIFFCYIPIANAKIVFDTTAKQVNDAVQNVDQIAKELRISAIQTIDTLNRLDRFEQGICADIPNLLPTFCGV